MNHLEFIEKNVKEELIKSGFSLSVAQGGAWQAVDHYKRLSQASKKGRMFDDVLRFAKLWAEKQVGKSELSKNKRSKREIQSSFL